MGHPIRRCVGHDDRVERHPLAPVGGDHCCPRATEMIEPEELREAVGRARRPPPPLQIGGLVQPGRGVSVAGSLQQPRYSGQIVETNEMLLPQ